LPGFSGKEAFSMSRHRGRTWVVAGAVVLTASLVATPARAIDDLSLNVSAGSEAVQPGDLVYVTLDVSSLSAAINGVQALIQYDNTLLSLLTIAPTDLGLIPPAEGWVEVFFADVDGNVDYAAAVNGGDVLADGTVATLVFQAVAEGTTNVSFRADADPFYTKLTVASNNTTLYPTTADSGNITSFCDDGLYCNGTETFVSGSCQTGTPPDCSGFTGPCSDGVCNEVADTCEAQPINEGLGCDDLDLCTQGDTCVSGVCTGTTVDCSSLDDACSVGQCNPLDGLCEAVPTNEGGSCDDGLFCNGVDTCSSGVCVSAGDPCAPLVCDEVTDSCSAPIHVAALEVFYAGRFGDAADTSRAFLGTGATATLQNITNYLRGITGIRIYFNDVVTFETTAEAAFLFEWTTGVGTTFTPVTSPAGNIFVTAAEQGGVTVVTVDLADDYVRRRWLKVSIDATQVTLGGVELDGELSGNPVGLPSGDGSTGGDAVFYLGNVTGDADGDRKTLLTDVGMIRARVNPFLNVPVADVYDVDKDGKVLLPDVGGARLDVNPFFTLPLITP
jgi:hypothetical protein